MSELHCTPILYTTVDGQRAEGVLVSEDHPADMTPTGRTKLGPPEILDEPWTQEQLHAWWTS